MRQNLEMVETLRRANVDFIPMPIRDEAHRVQLSLEAKKVLDEYFASMEVEGSMS
jgi:hypothetical protein